MRAVFRALIVIHSDFLTPIPLEKHIDVFTNKYLIQIYNNLQIYPDRHVHAYAVYLV